MSEIDDFVQIIRNHSNKTTALTMDQAGLIVMELNSFLYPSSEGVGTLNVLGQNYEYFSAFHKYWHEHHEELLNLQISDERCEAVARALHDVYVRTNGRAFQEVYDTYRLTDEQICRIRFLTANQDFRGSRNFEELATIYRSDNSIYDERNIAEEPGNFVRQIGIQSLSQNDKRIQYSKKTAEFLLEHNSSPYDIIDCFDRDVWAFRNALIAYPSAGYGNKKTDMFIRDMVVLNVWPIDTITNFDRIDVASDVNTVKVALRTGILYSAIPLLSSFLDIFGYQYSYVDEKNALAWRRVYETWNRLFPEEVIASPCLLDYFVYNVVGKQFCQEKLSIFRGNECGHIFRWHSARNQTCQECNRLGIRRQRACVIEKKLACNDEQGYIYIRETDFYRSGIAEPNFEECPFKTICDNYAHKNLQPPKSISIMGQTGWISGYSKEGEGGGGIMA